MTIPATLSLRQFLIARLRGDAGLVALLGGPKVYDHVPERTQPPLVALAADASAWDTTNDYGHEIGVDVNAWSRAEGRAEAERILHVVSMSLRACAPAVLADHRLVNMTAQTVAVLREDGGQTYRGYARFRAVTEEL